MESYKVVLDESIYHYSHQKTQIDQQKDFMNTVRDSMRQQQQQTQQTMVLMAQIVNTLKKAKFVKRKEGRFFQSSNTLLTKLT